MLLNVCVHLIYILYISVDRLSNSELAYILQMPYSREAICA